MSDSAGDAAAGLVYGGAGTALEGLAPVLSPGRRRRLAEALLRGTLEALQASRTVDRVLVAAPDRRAREVARGLGARPLPAPNAEEALGACLREVKDAGVSVLALLDPALPLLRPEDVAFLVGRALRRPVAALVPEPDAPRTSLAVLRPWEAFTVVPGRDCRAYAEEAEGRGVATEVHRLPAGQPLGRPQDLLAVHRSERPGRAKALLKTWDGTLLDRIREAAG